MSYEPSFTADTAADEADRKLLSPRACRSCGAVMDNSLDDECCDCWEAANVEDDDDEPYCMDCGCDLDPNGFCDECDGDPWEA